MSKLVRRAQKRIDFMKDLSSLLNRYSMESEWDMPDFIMAELITDFIYSSGNTMKKNLDWHGVDSVCHPNAQVFIMKDTDAELLKKPPSKGEQGR